ncbi:MAG TPA: gamma-glutamyltransferase, partial [Kofleriaceae bacterium]|nr:gamma-glutamyltransferase [Kofleriaceae bacterium]
IDPHAPAAGLALEEGTPAPVADELAAMGHRVRIVTGWERALFGRGQVIARAADGGLLGGSDGRADGLAAAG